MLNSGTTSLPDNWICDTFVCGEEAGKCTISHFLWANVKLPWLMHDKNCSGRAHSWPLVQHSLSLYGGIFFTLSLVTSSLQCFTPIVSKKLCFLNVTAWHERQIFRVTHLQGNVSDRLSVIEYSLVLSNNKTPIDVWDWWGMYGCQLTILWAHIVKRQNEGRKRERDKTKLIKVRGAFNRAHTSTGAKQA